MASFNKVILAGNLTRDPEVRYTPKGTAVAKLALAVNRRWTGEDGQAREEVTYVDVDAFGKQAETLGAHAKKGGGLLVEGRLRLEEWDDKKTGQKRTRLGVVLEGFQFLGSKPEGATPQRQAAAAPPRKFNERSPTAPVSSESGPEDSDDVPF
jgi:single-strand DNA-binding protein